MQEIKASRFYENGDHPLDIFSFIAACGETKERCALVTIVRIIGRASRNIGAQMAVSESGRAVGYISSGCIDADVIQNAQTAIATGEAKRLHYGEGSPFIDMKLPCGGGLEIVITPDPDQFAVRSVLQNLIERRPAALRIEDNGSITAPPDASLETGRRKGAFLVAYEPKLKLILAGRGQELICLAGMARCAGFDVVCYSPKKDDLRLCADIGCQTHHLASTETAPSFSDDPWTAEVLLFHDHEWEPALLERAFTGNAFYIGALGSEATHRARCETLRLRGASACDLARIKGPIGLLPAMRSAPMLAISVLAEIVDEFNRRKP